MLQKTSLKRYLISSGITFVTAFLLAVLPLVQTITVDTLSKSAVLALIFTGLRAGVKALVEFLQSSVK